MGKRKEITKTFEVVENVLEEFEEARNSDDFLFFMVCNQIGKQNGVNVTNATMQDVFSMKFMPSYETVTRARRKIQEKGKYKSAKCVRKNRLNNEEIFKNWSVGK